MIKLSLVVPTYGVEKYIPKFLKSLEPNLQPGVEVLVINDGTKDNSAKIAEEFSDKYPDYVKVIHKENGGVSSARNKGIELAKGEYIIFPDPDDYLAEDYVGTILTAIDEYEVPDMIFFDYFSGSEKKGFKRSMILDFKEGIVDKEKFIREFIKDNGIQGFTWNKAVRKSLYEGLCYNTHTRYAQDYELMTDLALRFEKVVYIPKPLYYYVMRGSSTSHTTSIKDLLKAYDLTLDRQLKYSKLYKDLSIYALVRETMTLLINAYEGENVGKIDQYEDFINKNIKSIILSRDFKLNEKKQCLLVYFGFARAYYKTKSKR